MALDELLDEHEQSEKVRNWLRSNAPGLIGGLVLGVAIIGGWNWWQARAHQQRVQLSEDYRAAVDSIEAGDLDKASALADALGEGAYAEIVTLDLAKAQLEAGKRDEAIATLRRAAGSKAGNPGLEAVIQQRLARLLIDAGKADEAVTLLADAKDAAAFEARGDAYFSLGNAEAARSDYNAALQQLDVAAPQRSLLELKLAEVGGQSESTETQS